MPGTLQFDEGALLGLSRHLPERGVLAEQLVVRSNRDQPTVFQHRDPIAAADGGQPMRDHDQRLASVETVNGLHDLLFGLGVECRHRFVEDQHLGSPIERPRDRDALPLTTGQSHAAFADVRVHAVWQRVDELLQPCKSDHVRKAPLVDLGVTQPEADVAAQRVVDQEELLRHVSNLSLPSPERLLNVGAVDGDLSSGWLE